MGYTARKGQSCIKQQMVKNHRITIPIKPLVAEEWSKESVNLWHDGSLWLCNDAPVISKSTKFFFFFVESNKRKLHRRSYAQHTHWSQQSKQSGFQLVSPWSGNELTVWVLLHLHRLVRIGPVSGPSSGLIHLELGLNLCNDPNFVISRTQVITRIPHLIHITTSITSQSE